MQCRMFSAPWLCSFACFVAVTLLRKLLFFFVIFFATSLAVMLLWLAVVPFGMSSCRGQLGCISIISFQHFSTSFQKIDEAKFVAVFGLCVSASAIHRFWSLLCFGVIYVWVCVWACMYICVCVCVCVYIFTHMTISMSTHI